MYTTNWLRSAAPALFIASTVLWIRCGHPSNAQSTNQQTAPTAILHSPISSGMQDTIKALSEQYHPWVVSLRRHLHQYPEISGNEQQTQRFIISTLKEIGLNNIQTGLGGGYSVVVDIPGKNPTKDTIAARGDTDALPIVQQSDSEYQSKHKGIMHACGHDAHTANLLGVAKILHTIRDQFEGTVRLIFQPHEEVIPGGAKPLIDAGVLNGCSKVIGLHVDPNIPVSQVGFRANAYMASVDMVHIYLVGKGGHGGSGLHKTLDPVLAQAHLLIALEQIKTHNIDARSSMVLSFGQASGGTAPNVIPDHFEMHGTLRTLDPEVRSKAKKRIQEICDGVSEASGVAINLRIEEGYPVLINDETYTLAMKNASDAYLGDQNVLMLDQWMASEDFSYYGQNIPGCFFRLGVKNETKGIVHGLHTARFDLDEDALLHGTGLMSWLILNSFKPSLFNHSNHR